MAAGRPVAEHSDREFRNLGQPWSAPLPVRATFSILHLPFQALKKRTRVVRTKKPKEKNQILLSQLFLIELDGPGHFKVPGISSLNRLILLAKEKTGEFSKGSIGRNGKVSYRAVQGNINVITLQSTYHLLQYLGNYQENGKDVCEVERFSGKGARGKPFPGSSVFSSSSNSRWNTHKRTCFSLAGEERSSDTWRWSDPGSTE